MLFGLAAGVPLALVLVIFVIVLLARGSRPSTGTDAGAGNGNAAEVAKSKLAPAERLTGAVALGPEALETLAKEFPEDTSVLAKLAVAYQAQNKSSEALRTVRTLLAADPSAATNEEIIQVVVAAAKTSQGDADDEAFSLLEGPLGDRGVDVLIDLTAKGQGREAQALRARAAKSLAKPEVRGHAAPGAAVLLDLRAATSCAAKHDLLARVKEHGDTRLTPALKSLKATRGCGFLSRQDCWPCMRRDTALDEATTAAETRSAPR